MDRHVARRDVALEERDIAQVVSHFYAKVRRDPVIGAIFTDRLGTDPEIWSAHEEKITCFWRNALLRAPVYSGNPMMVHAGISALEPAHFARWLALFDETLAATLPSATAQSWSRLAHRIGKGLRFGLGQARERQGGAPDLS